MRAAYGLLLLARPELLCLPFGVGPVDRRVRIFARILGIRQLLEAGLLRRHPERRWRLAGAAVDATHAATMLVVAARDARHRRLALANALVAAAFAAASATASRR